MSDVSPHSQAMTAFSWYAFFKAISQMVSWCVTLVVARLLLPEDYGLMAMATLLTGYAALFSELGLGSAIVQRKTNDDDELSSVFWFSLMSGAGFALCCLFLAYPTAYLFHESRLVPVTMTTAVLFLINGMAVVPANLLRKEMAFKRIGKIEMISIIVSSLCMLLIAMLGGGVWTLVGGHIIRDFFKMIMFSRACQWKPKLHFSFKEASRYLKFGILIAFGNSLRYTSDKADRFFASRIYSAHLLGYYTFALELAQIPTDKIVSLMNQVSYSAFCKLQDSLDELQNLYLKLSKTVVALILPLYVGGFLVGHHLILVVLGDKWVGAIWFFRYLCLAQITKTLLPMNYQIHVALGRPGVYLKFRILTAIFAVVAFGMSVNYFSFKMIIVPWLGVYSIMYIFLLLFTLATIKIPFLLYLRTISHPLCATLILVIVVLLFDVVAGGWVAQLAYPDFVNLGCKIFVGMVFTVLYYFFFDRESARSVVRFVKSKQI